MGINEIVLTVSIVFMVRGGHNIGSGSGFFYTSGDKLFLVTNQHVMCDDQKGLIPDKLRLRLHTDVSNTKSNDNYEINLYSEDKPLWKIHPQFADADVALIELDQIKIRQKFIIRAWSKESFLPKKYRLDPGEDVFVMGYPLRYYDTINNLPLFRNAMIASTYRVYFRNNPLFLIDANLHKGISGSPVITKPKNAWVDDSNNVNFMTGNIYYLVGVISGKIDKKITSGQEIDLGASWYAELIEDIALLF